MNKKWLLGSLVAVMLLGAGSASALIIDDFSGDTFSKVDAPLAGAAAGTSSGGYARTVDATSIGADTSVQINTMTNPGVFAHSQDSGVRGTSQVNFALGGIDLTGAGTLNAFQISIESIDQNGVFGIIVDGESVALNSTPVINTNGGSLPSLAEILFKDFTVASLTNVSSLSLFIDGSGTLALDASISLLSTTCSALNESGGSGVSGTPGQCSTNSTIVPEPTTLVLFGLGLAGLGYRRRKNLHG